MDTRTSLIGESRQQAGWVIVPLVGEFDMANAMCFRSFVVEQVSAEHYHLVVDCTELTYIDSSGLGALVGARRRIKPYDGEIRLAAASDRVLKIFKLTGLINVFRFFDDSEAALLRSDVR